MAGISDYAGEQYSICSGLTVLDVKNHLNQKNIPEISLEQQKNLFKIAYGKKSSHLGFGKK